MDDDDFYAGDFDDDQGFNDDQEFNDEAVDGLEEVIPESNLPNNYTVLNQSEIRRRIDDDISRLSSVLMVTKSEASTLLIHYNWSVSSVHDSWFVDEGIREKVGLFEKPVIDLPESEIQIRCEICFEDVNRQEIRSASCGHPYCSDCWRSYISAAVSDGPGCLKLRCPHPSRCAAAVSLDMIKALATEEEKEKYDVFLINFYIESDKKTKWCPSAGCEFAVDFDIGSEDYDICCSCSHQFCWNCTDEAHRPVDCETVNKWNLKNSSEAENVNYILAFTKPCPKCKKPIEKNQGCNRMTCKCGHQFCWICLLDWTVHGYSGKCNGYQTTNSEEEIKKHNAREYLARYAHYFERFATNARSLKKAVADLKHVEEEKINILSQVQNLTMVETEFLIEAWEQIVSCRRFLKWTYAYGFYLPMEEEGKRKFFEYVQGEAESALERLHHCSEKELEPFIKEKSFEFYEFKRKLSGLTAVTRNYFRNLVTALENGLSEVKSGSKHERSSGSTKPKKRTKRGLWA